jgi:hypothetical protein
MILFIGDVEALPRHREDPVAALRQEVVDKDAAAGPDVAHGRCA